MATLDELLEFKNPFLGKLFTNSRNWLMRGGTFFQDQQGPRCQSIRTTAMANAVWLVKKES